MYYSINLTDYNRVYHYVMKCRHRGWILSAPFYLSCFAFEKNPRNELSSGSKPTLVTGGLPTTRSCPFGQSAALTTYCSTNSSRFCVPHKKYIFTIAFAFPPPLETARGVPFPRIIMINTERHCVHVGSAFIYITHHVVIACLINCLLPQVGREDVIRAKHQKRFVLSPYVLMVESRRLRHTPRILIIHQLLA